MSAQNFQVSDTNPNDSVGGGGCACSETKVPDAVGPFLIFHAAESSSNISPHVVVCAGCVVAGCSRLDNGDLLAAGEKVPHQSAPDLTHDDDADLTEVPEV